MSVGEPSGGGAGARAEASGAPPEPPARRPGPDAGPSGPAAAEPASREPQRAPASPGATALGLAVVGLAVLVLAVRAGAEAHPIAIVYAGKGIAASVVVALVGGLGAARLLVPRTLAPWWPLLALPLGPAVVGLALTALGVAAIRGTPALVLVAALSVGLLVAGMRRPGLPAVDRVATAGLLLAGALAGLGALLPTAVSGGVTVFGQNPDAHQAVGTALYLREGHPFGVDVGTALDRVPVVWQFRYPMLYVLEAVSAVAGQPPVRVFAALGALLVGVLAVGSGLLAQRIAGLPRAAAVPIGAACGLAGSVAHAALHPYFNQLWGMALLPWLLLLGLALVDDRDRRALLPFVLVLVLAFLSYPVAGPYPLLVLGLLALAGDGGRAGALGDLRGGLARRRAARRRAGRRARRWPWILAALVFALPLLGAAAKLLQAGALFLDPSARLWEGDRGGRFLPLGFPVGLPSQAWWWLPVATALGALALARGPARAPRRAIAWAVVGLGLVGFSLLLRERPTGAYMDYKHLSFTGVVLLPLALAGLVRLVLDGTAALRGAHRGRGRVAAAAVLAAGALGLGAWTAAAGVAQNREMDRATEQVTSFTQELAGWSREIPEGRTVLLDVPASGTQLWAMLAVAREHPVAARDPVGFTTYAVAPQGAYADYVLSLRTVEGTTRPRPRPPGAVGAPVLANQQWALWRMSVPVALRRAVPDTASWRLRQPLEPVAGPLPGGDPDAGKSFAPVPAPRPGG